MLRAILTSLSVIVSFSCVQRVAIPHPPPSGSSQAVRERALRDLSPSGQLDVAAVNRSGTVANQTTAFLMLGNGLRIEDPRDLLPAVLPDSATAMYANRYGETTGRVRVVTVVSLIGEAAGLVVGTLGMAAGISTRTSPGTPIAIAGVTTFAVSALVGLIWTGIDGSHVDKDRASAFLAYPNDLRRRLGLLDEVSTWRWSPSSEAPLSSVGPLVGRDTDELLPSIRDAASCCLPVRARRPEQALEGSASEEEDHQTSGSK